MVRKMNDTYPIPPPEEARIWEQCRDKWQRLQQKFKVERKKQERIGAAPLRWMWISHSVDQGERLQDAETVNIFDDEVEDNGHDIPSVAAAATSSPPRTLDSPYSRTVEQPQVNDYINKSAEKRRKKLQGAMTPLHLLLVSLVMKS